ncbi:MAG TPA: FAD-dependent oxidoreductase, partial [Longimicrobiales bacterium]|nr:FAD-dependent oxidoreductase [Longimicrobiales bacterium]
PGHDALWRNGRAHGITYGSVTSMVASGALPMTLKLKMGAQYLPFLNRDARSLDANDPSATGGVAFDDTSIGEWGRQKLGRDFVELLAYPLLAAYYGATPEETSAAVYHALARVGMDVDVYGARGGFGALAAAVVRAIEANGGQVLTERKVTRIEHRDGDVVIDGDRFDAAILAVPAPAASSLLTQVGGAGEAVKWLGAVRQRPSFTVVYRLGRGLPGDWFGLSFPRGSGGGGRVAVMCVQSRKLPGLVEQGDAVVVIPAPGAVADLLERADDDIARTLLGDLEHGTPGIGQRVTSSHVFRWPDGYTLFPPGHLQHIRAFPATSLPANIALAGDYLVAPSVEGAVRSGTRAARRVLSDPA